MPLDRSLLTNFDKGLGSYQYFAQIATLDQQFARRVAFLFWQRYVDEFKRQPFQLCGCESGGVPVVCALQHFAFRHVGLRVNAFAIKKRQKTYGIKNWCEGIVLENTPVLMVDDVIGGLITMRAQGRRLLKFGLELGGGFAIAAVKPNREPALIIDGEHLFDVDTFFRPEDFTPRFARYVAKYGRQPTFFGIMG